MLPGGETVISFCGKYWPWVGEIYKCLGANPRGQPLGMAADKCITPCVESLCGDTSQSILPQNNTLISVRAGKIRYFDLAERNFNHVKTTVIEIEPWYNKREGPCFSLTDLLLKDTLHYFRKDIL